MIIFHFFKYFKQTKMQYFFHVKRRAQPNHLSGPTVRQNDISVLPRLITLLSERSNINADILPKGKSEICTC